MLDPANIHRSNRRTLSLFIDERGTLIVRAPNRMPVSKIYQFVTEKEDWILRQQERIMQNRFRDPDVLAYNKFLHLGTPLVPYVTDSVKKVCRQDGLILVPSKFAAQGEAAAIKKVEKWLRDEAKMIVDERCFYFSARLNLAHGKIGVNNNKTRWGVCDLDGNIMLNWRAVMLPPRLLDYIIVHEFCHLLEFNHTREFWALVETILPKWRLLRRELKQFGWILSLFRPQPKGTG